MQQWDASHAPQAFTAFRPSDNSPFRRHLTRTALLCDLYIPYGSMKQACCQGASLAFSQIAASKQGRTMGLDTGRFIDKCKQGVMQISLISFCKAKALAIHRLIGAQQSGSISFFAQTISGEEVPRKGTAGSSPWYAFASFPRIRKGRAPPRHERQRKGYRVPRRGMSSKSEKLL